jgi:arabinogalactan endo-1,4-beta-galactosidase
MAAIIDASRNKTNGHCKGVFYWAPELEGPYPLGAFQDGKPTAIMEAFTEASR